MKIHDRNGTNTLVVDEDGAASVSLKTSSSFVQTSLTQTEALGFLLTEQRLTNVLLGQLLGLEVQDIAAMRGDRAVIVN